MPNARPLPHQPVEKQRRVLRDLVVLDEQLVKLVDDQQNPRQLSPSRSTAGTPPDLARRLRGTDRRADAARHRAAAKHGEPKLALAFDRHDARVRQLVRGIGLELHALLEVDQVQLDLVGAVE